MKTLTSIGPANRITRSEETHPLTWRLTPSRYGWRNTSRRTATRPHARR
jgi:hypothetical protein